MNLLIGDRNQYLLRLSEENDIPAIRLLVNAAYKELADMGLNYTATYQDEEETRRRLSQGRAFVLLDQDKIIATILFKKENKFTNRNTAYLGQLAIQPELKRLKIGTLLMNFCEGLATNEGFDGIQLDTAKPATHLVSWYQRRGYQIVGETRWEGKTYESWIFEKPLTAKKSERPSMPAL